jgi:hypothetical protein
MRPLSKLVMGVRKVRGVRATGKSPNLKRDGRSFASWGSSGKQLEFDIVVDVACRRFKSFTGPIRLYILPSLPTPALPPSLAGHRSPVKTTDETLDLCIAIPVPFTLQNGRTFEVVYFARLSLSRVAVGVVHLLISQTWEPISWRMTIPKPFTVSVRDARDSKGRLEMFQRL